MISLFFVALFIGIAVLDSKEYQRNTSRRARLSRSERPTITFTLWHSFLPRRSEGTKGDEEIFDILTAPAHDNV